MAVSTIMAAITAIAAFQYGRTSVIANASNLPILNLGKEPLAMMLHPASLLLTF
jgi:hypothetical protein